MKSIVVSMHELMDEIPQDSIVSRTLCDSPRQKTVLFGFDEGQELNEHTSKMAASLVVVDGRCRVTLDGETKECGSGTWIYMPPGTPHAIKAETKLLLLLVLFRDSSD